MSVWKAADPKTLHWSSSGSSETRVRANEFGASEYKLIP